MFITRDGICYFQVLTDLNNSVVLVYLFILKPFTPFGLLNLIYNLNPIFWQYPIIKIAGHIVSMVVYLKISYT